MTTAIQVDLARPGEDRMVISMLLAVRVESEANLQAASYGQRMAKARRTKIQRSIAKNMVGQALRDIGIRPGYFDAGNKDCLVVLTRIAPRSLDDDNLPRSFKAIRDGIAEALGMDDNTKSKLKWQYAQEKGPPKQYAIRIQIQPREGQPRSGEGGRS